MRILTVWQNGYSKFRHASTYQVTGVKLAFGDTFIVQVRAVGAPFIMNAKHFVVRIQSQVSPRQMVVRWNRKINGRKSADFYALIPFQPDSLAFSWAFYNIYYTYHDKNFLVRLRDCGFAHYSYRAKNDLVAKIFRMFRRNRQESRRISPSNLGVKLSCAYIECYDTPVKHASRVPSKT